MLDVLAFLHQRLALALVLFALILGLWGAYQFLRHRALSGGFRSSYLAMAGLTAVQGALGAILLATGHGPKQLLHVVYGAFAVVFLPGVYTYAKGAKDREAVFLAASCWIVLVAFGRGVVTGQ